MNILRTLFGLGAAETSEVGAFKRDMQEKGFILSNRVNGAIDLFLRRTSEQQAEIAVEYKDSDCGGGLLCITQDYIFCLHNADVKKESLFFFDRKTSRIRESQYHVSFSKPRTEWDKAIGNYLTPHWWPNISIFWDKEGRSGLFDLKFDKQDQINLLRYCNTGLLPNQVTLRPSF